MGHGETVKRMGDNRLAKIARNAKDHLDDLENVAAKVEHRRRTGTLAKVGRT
jgi:hypothetical protein